MKSDDKKDASAMPEQKKQGDAKLQNPSERTENIVAITVFALLILIGVALFTKGFGLFGKSANSNERIQVPIDGNDVYRGPEKPSVVIIGFSDYECPFCAKGELMVKDVMSRYPDDVAYVFKNFPLTGIHAQAFNASLAAECAKEQQKFWDYHDYLFEHQSDLSADSLREYAKAVGLDPVKFNDCFDRQRYSAKVKNDVQAGTLIGVGGTPTFFVKSIKAADAIRVVGAKADELLKAVDSELKANN